MPDINDHGYQLQTSAMVVLWLSQNRRLPCQMKISYKKDPGAPSTTVTYHGAETPQVTDDTFAAKIPDDYGHSLRRSRAFRLATAGAAALVVLATIDLSADKRGSGGSVRQSNKTSTNAGAPRSPDFQVFMTSPAFR